MRGGWRTCCAAGVCHWQLAVISCSLSHTACFGRTTGAGVVGGVGGRDSGAREDRRQERQAGADICTWLRRRSQAGGRHTGQLCRRCVALLDIRLSCRVRRRDCRTRMGRRAFCLSGHRGARDGRPSVRLGRRRRALGGRAHYKRQRGARCGASRVCCKVGGERSAAHQRRKEGQRGRGVCAALRGASRHEGRAGNSGRSRRARRCKAAGLQWRHSLAAAHRWVCRGALRPGRAGGRKRRWAGC